MNNLEAIDAWWEGAELPNVRFRYNDLVKVTGGPHAGMAASVISLETLGADPTYLVELTSGADRILPSSQLMPLEEKLELSNGVHLKITLASDEGEPAFGVLNLTDQLNDEVLHQVFVAAQRAGLSETELTTLIAGGATRSILEFAPARTGWLEEQLLRILEELGHPSPAEVDPYGVFYSGLLDDVVVSASHTRTRTAAVRELRRLPKLADVPLERLVELLRSESDVVLSERVPVEDAQAMASRLREHGLKVSVEERR